MTARRVPIDRSTMRSLHLTMGDEGGDIAHGTGFIVDYQNDLFLITNRHNLTGKNEWNRAMNRTGRTPTSLDVRGQFGMLGQFSTTVYNLYDEDGDALWFEHPQYKRLVDVVALEIDADMPNLDPYVIDESPTPEPILRVTDEVHVIGFPFHIDRGHLGVPVWTRASVASEPIINYEGRPRFLVDSRTRTGQSGSPVVLHQAIAFDVDSPVAEGIDNFYPSADRLLGVYSGRINEESDMGFVWKTAAIREILEAKVHPAMTDLAPIRDSESPGTS